MCSNYISLILVCHVSNFLLFKVWLLYKEKKWHVTNYGWLIEHRIEHTHWDREFLFSLRNFFVYLFLNKVSNSLKKNRRLTLKFLCNLVYQGSIPSQLSTRRKSDELQKHFMGFATNPLKF